MILGPRKTGKSTLVNYFIKEYKGEKMRVNGLSEKEF